ncbi:hypothetical protein ACFR97_03030 [Haloplanus litoreus]|uniref:DUF8152 domain-containing protein n=2 Tax=Haloplanus litoreus TaxID=767515 RepID=A0ABD5ZZJ0_9EURY
MTAADHLRTLHEQLAATEELPVRPDASPWLGEAAAITADAMDADLPSDVLADRIQRVAALLAEVETTGNPKADEHVAAAERAANRLLDAVD